MAHFYFKFLFTPLYGLYLDDIDYHQLETNISKSFRWWDYVNTNLIQFLDDKEYIVKIKKSKRGMSWINVFIYERSSKTLYSLMNKIRFLQLNHMDVQERWNHYLTCIAEIVNKDLPLLQQPFFEVDGHYQDEFTKIVERIMNDCELSLDQVVSHQIIVFEKRNGQVNKVECYAYNKNLEVVQSQDWSNYIEYKQDVEIEQSSAYEETANPIPVSLKNKAVQKRNVATKQANIIIKKQQNKKIE